MKNFSLPRNIYRRSEIDAMLSVCEHISIQANIMVMLGLGSIAAEPLFCVDMLSLVMSQPIRMGDAIVARDRILLHAVRLVHKIRGKQPLMRCLNDHTTLNQ